MLSTLVTLKAGREVETLSIVSHHFTQQDARANLERVVKEYIATRNAEKDYAPTVRDQDLDPLAWATFENCFYSTIDSAPTTNESAEDGSKIVVSVWEKYTRPGRVWGGTPKRRHDSVFLVIHTPIVGYELIPSAASCADESPKSAEKLSSPVKAADLKGSYKNVIDELKVRLEKRREQSIAAQLVEMSSEKARTMTPPPSPVTTRSDGEHESDNDDDDDGCGDEMIHRRKWRVFMNPLWQPDAVDSFPMNHDTATEPAEYSSSSESEEYQRPTRGKKRVHFSDQEKPSSPLSLSPSPPSFSMVTRDTQQTAEGAAKSFGFKQQDEESSTNCGFHFPLHNSSPSRDNTADPFGFWSSSAETAREAAVARNNYEWSEGTLDLELQDIFKTAGSDAAVNYKGNSSTTSSSKFMPVADFERELDEIIASMIRKDGSPAPVTTFKPVPPEGACASEWLSSYLKVVNEWRDNVLPASTNTCSTEDDMPELVSTSDEEEDDDNFSSDDEKDSSSISSDSDSDSC